jgi:Secretion system C-terminal sorting domain
MKQFLLAAFAFFIFLQNSFAQPTAYFTFSNSYAINKIIKINSNQYAAVASYAYGKILVKFDALFNPIWYKQLTSIANHTILDLTETNSGNFVLLTDNVDSSFVYKFSNTGSLLHSKYFTSAIINNFTPTNCTHAISGDGILLAGGYCNVENYLVRLDDNLNIVWKYQYRDGTGTCANSRASDMVTEANKYTFTSNPSSGGINLVSVDDNGTVIDTKNYALALQPGGYPLQLIRLQNGAYIATWASADISKGKQFIFIDSTKTNAVMRNYNLGYFYYLNEYIEYEPNKIMIGGTNIFAINNNQTNILLALDEKGMIQWCKKSESINNPASPSQINTFCKALDQHVFAFGGSGLDGAYGAKLDAQGNGFCNSTSPIIAMANSDSITSTARTLTRLALNALQTGNSNLVMIDSSFTKKVECGMLENAPLAAQQQKDFVTEIKVYPVPCSNELNLEKANATLKSIIQIFDIFGKKIHSCTIVFDNDIIKINTASLQKGIYVIEITEGKHVWKKIIEKQ